MKSLYAKPTWRPELTPDMKSLKVRLEKYLGRQKFTMFANGTCVVWPTGRQLSQLDCDQTLLSVVLNAPDFKVRQTTEGDFLVTFKGGVGGVLPGEFLFKHFNILQDEALAMGKLPTERFMTENVNEVSDVELVAGLYVRAKLYLDVQVVEAR